MPVYDYTVDLSNTNSSHVKVLQLVDRHVDVLEIGCATGYMTRILKEQLDCRVFAVESDAEAAQKAAPFCHELVVGDIEDLPIETLSKNGNKFDAILMADVIEHLKDAEGVLNKIRHLLAPGGYCVISIPNGAHGSMALEVMDGKWDYRREGLLDQTHLHFFDFDNFKALLDKTGFFISQLDRVVVHPRDTEMKTPWDSYPREITAYIEKVNPEYKTYQFVIKAFPMTDRGWRKGLEDTIASQDQAKRMLETTLESKEDELRHLRAESAGFNQEFKKRETEHLDNLKREMDRLEEEKSQLHKDYRLRMSELEMEIKTIHTGYHQKIESLETEKATLHQAYGKTITSLESEKEGIESAYLKTIEKITNDSQREKDHFRLQENHLKAALADLEKWKNDAMQELSTIRGSLAWRFIVIYRRCVEAMLPPGTRRQRFYRLCMLAPVVLFREGPLSFLKKIVQRIPPRKNKEVVRVDLPGEATIEEAYHLKDIGPFIYFERVIVSIVIPVYNQFFHTHRCLHAIKAHSTVPYEVIVVDNASTDETSEKLGSIQNINTIQNLENLGFVEACNAGVNAARGNYVLLLNNDTEVTPGWLEAMMAPFTDDRVGAVGAKLIYPDGRLQEAGNIVWQDGSGWNYGRGDNPDLFNYNYLKEVDYCSGAALMVPKKLWDRIGGFDSRFAPAYYEDTDLCFSIRSKGYRVMYQPDARIIHHEGATAGTDISRGFKRYQPINLEKFKEKWGETLAVEHFPGPEYVYLARERGIKKRAMVVDHYAPTFDKDSGSLRMFNLVKILTELGYKVVFWPENRTFSGIYTKTLQDMGVEVIYGDILFDDYMRENGSVFDLVILSRPHVAIQFIHAVKAFSKAKIIYDTVDLHFLREARKAAIEMDDRQRWQTAALSRDWKNKELFLCHVADRVLVVSPIEREILEKEDGLEGKVAVVSNIHSVESCCNGFEERSGLMFIGGFMHEPNEDGIVWFATTIFPKLIERIPDIHLTIVGSHPTDAVLALASESVTVTGYVADVTPYFEKARVFVSPLRYGAGVKGKIGHSLSYGVPVVTTPIGAEGMGLVDGENALIADSENDFYKKVTDVYEDQNLWHKLSENGRQHIESSFSPEVIKEKLQLVCEGDTCA